MGDIRKLCFYVGIVSMLALQACALTPKPVDPLERQGALERWNRCLQQFEAQAEQFCDGHRRDVLSTFPVHLENQLDTLLSQQIRANRAKRLVKTGLGTSSDISDRAAEGMLTPTEDGARKSDL